VDDEKPHTNNKVLEGAGCEEAPFKEEKNDEQKKPFAGFVEKLILLVIGFALTTLVGGFLADRFRRESAKTELEIAAMQSDIGRSVQVFENISQLMDKRLFRMRRLHDVFNGNVGSDAFPQRLADYRSVLIEWNDNLNRYRALYAFAFTPAASRQSPPVTVTDSCATSFEAIAGSFTALHIELQKLIDKKGDGSAQKTQGLLDDLNVCIYILDERMLSSINDLRTAYKNKITNH
jgi:hypothetical protein